MKRLIPRILSGLLLWGLIPAFSQADPLTVEQAIDTSIRNNLQLQATQARLGVSDAEIVTAGARLNPSLLSDNGIAEKTYRLGAEQTIELGGKRKQRIAVAQAQRNAVNVEVNIALLNLRTDVRRAYTDLFTLQERQATLENILDVAKELVDIAQKREKAGDISTLDVLQTDILRVSAQNDLQSISVALLNAKSRLNTLLNQPLDSMLILTPPNTAPQIGKSGESVRAPSGTLQGRVTETDMNLDDLIAQALSHRPEVQQNLQSIEIAKRQSALAKANRIPNLSLTVGPDFVAEPDQRELNVFLIGTMEIPLFNRQQGPIQEALARQNQFQKEQAALKSRITLEVSNAYNAFNANQARIRRYEVELLPMAVKITEKSRRAFQEGKTAIFTPIQAQQAYMNACLGYLQALSDFQNAISDLERAVGAGL